MAKFVTIKTMERAKKIERKQQIKSVEWRVRLPSERGEDFIDHKRMNVVFAMPTSTNYRQYQENKAQHQTNRLAY